MTKMPVEQARELLRRWTNAPDPRVLGEGMEGAVYEIDDDRVAKIWFSGSAEVLEKARRFYVALADRTFSFAVPRIEEVATVDDHVVSVERRLFGTPLSDLVSAGRVADGAARTLFVDILAELADSGPLPEARELSVLGGGEMLYRGDETFAQALAALATRRVTRFHDVFDAVVTDLDRKLAALTERVQVAASDRLTVVHGDMILANILVDDSGSPAAVLDWGFFTTEGDPVFDAAVAASIFNMYGDDARDTELDMYGRIETRMGYDREQLLVYRAAYSMISANAYDPDGRDGHFAWCAAALDRPDVVAALLD